MNCSSSVKDPLSYTGYDIINRSLNKYIEDVLGLSMLDASILKTLILIHSSYSWNWNLIEYPNNVRNALIQAIMNFLRQYILVAIRLADRLCMDESLRNLCNINIDVSGMNHIIVNHRLLEEDIVPYWSKGYKLKFC